MSGSDSDLPDLVDSDEDSPMIEKPPEKTNADYVDIWLRKSEKFLEKQENYIRIFSLGPFLFALNNLVPKPWMASLKTAGLLLNDKREKDLSGLDWEEWSLVDLVENVITVMLKNLRKKQYLIAVLNSVDKLNGDPIDITVALEEAAQINYIKKLWSKALKAPSCKKKETETKFAVLYVGKLYHLVVIGLARDCKDVAEEMKKSLRQKGVDPVRLKDTGNKEYQSGKFETASDYYARAARADPLNHIYLGNRAQVNNKLKKYREALADGRRAILLKPDWTKGHYRYAQAFYELDKLDMAITVNRKGQEICRTSKSATDNNFKDLVLQGETYKKERDDKLKKEKIRKAFESAISDEKDLPEALKALPGQKRVINLSEAWKFLDDEPNADLDVPELISSESDSSEEDVPELVEDDELIKKKSVSGVKNNKKAKIDKVDTSAKSVQNNKSSSTAAQNNKSSTTAAQNTKSSTAAQNNKSSTVVQKPPKTSVEPSDKVSKKSSKSGTENKQEAPQPSNKGGKKQPNKMSVKKSENSEFDKLLREGSEAFLADASKNAVTLYKKALDYTTNNTPIETFGLDREDFVTLKFACGFASVTTGLHKLILEGIEMFNDILKSHQDVRFPLAYYGLGKAYVSLNRYPDAIDPLKTGLRIVDRIKVTVVTWPGTQTKIEQGVPQTLRKLLKDLLMLCRYPPTPDGRCCYHTDTEETRTVIFFEDPDFKGFVRMFCKSRCIIEFHNYCWKIYKTKFGDRVSEKDILDTPCPTPDCEDIICKIFIFRQDSNCKSIESEKIHKEPRPKKALKKLPLSNIYKIERKRERKELRKQRRRECREELDDLSDKDSVGNTVPLSVENKTIDVKEEAAGGIGETEDAQEENVEKKPATKLSKDEEDWKLAKYKGTKKQKNTKKKKEKVPTKTVINLEVNFSDDREKNLLGEDAAEDEEIIDRPKMPMTSSTVPTERQEMVAMETHHDECTSTLFTFFADMLRENGPMHVQDTIISSMLEEFPKEAKDRIDSAGGLGSFLQQSLQFAMIDGIICLLKDAEKAREIAFARKNNMKQLNLKQPYIKKENPWKTIGKGTIETQNVDNSDFPSISGTGSNLEHFNMENDNQNLERTNDNIQKETLEDLDDIDDISFSTNTVEKTMKNTYDSLDDFAPIHSKITSNNLNSLDTMDSIDDIPLYTATKKVKKKHLEDSDDLKSVSETDSESVQDGSISDVVRMSNIDSLKSSMWEDKIDYYKTKDDKFSSGDQLSNMSRSSSRSDISEQSDISSELMAKAYKQTNRQSPLVTPVVTKATWPNKDVGLLPSTAPRFGPVGSPVPISADKGFDVTICKPLPSSHNGMTFHQEVTAATEQQIRKIDTELVNELAEEVVDQMYSGKNVSESQRSLTFDRISGIIWSDFKKSSESSGFPLATSFGARSPFGNSPGDNAVEFSSKKKSYAEQFMKNHYQQKVNTDPAGLGETFMSPFSVSQGYPSISSNSIWSNSNSVNKMTASSFPNPPPPLTLPPSKTNPFGNITIGTSLGTSVTQAEPLPHFPSFSSPFSMPGMNNSSGNNITSVSMCSQSTQVSPELKCMETNTDPYEPYKEDYIRAREERDYFEKSLTDATKQLQEITTLLQQRDQRCKV